jgi:hypothetical protein
MTLPHLARADHGRHPDPDDLPARRLRRDPRHHQWRAGLCVHQPRLPHLPHRRPLEYDVGGASAGGIIAVVLANIVAFFLMRAVGKNLDGRDGIRLAAMARRSPSTEEPIVTRRSPGWSLR